MAFSSAIQLPHCAITYHISPQIKQYTLKDLTFTKNKVGNFEFTRLLEIVPNSGDGVLMRIIVNPDLTGFKLSITDQSGLRHVDIFKDSDQHILQDKFYYQMNLFVERDVFTKS